MMLAKRLHAPAPVGLKAHVVLKTESSKEKPVTPLPSSRTTTCACIQPKRVARLPPMDATVQRRGCKCGVSRHTEQSPCTSTAAAAPWNCIKHAHHASSMLSVRCIFFKSKTQALQARSSGMGRLLHYADKGGLMCAGAPGRRCRGGCRSPASRSARPRAARPRGARGRRTRTRTGGSASPRTAGCCSWSPPAPARQSPLKPSVHRTAVLGVSRAVMKSQFQLYAALAMPHGCTAACGRRLLWVSSSACALTLSCGLAS